ncbi:hypothetical protein MRY82_10050 [bacterium]|nr:hypothetical protein [bacterium]
MKHVFVLSFLLITSIALAQGPGHLSDPDQWQRLDGGVDARNTQNTHPRNSRTHNYSNDQYEQYYWLDGNYYPSYSNTVQQKPSRTIHQYQRGQIKICKFGTNFMRIITPNSQQTFNYTLSGRSPIVTVVNTTIQLHVDTDGSWHAVDEKNDPLFQEVECD